MKDDVTEIKADVKSLLKFKWTIMGGAGIVGVVISLVLASLNIIK